MRERLDCMQYKWKVVLFTLLLAVLLTACGKGNEDAIIGHWKGEDDGDVEFVLEIDEDELTIREPDSRDSVTAEYIVSNTTDDRFMLEITDPSTGSNTFLFEGYFDGKNGIIVEEVEGGAAENASQTRSENVMEEIDKIAKKEEEERMKEEKQREKEEQQRQKEEEQREKERQKEIEEVGYNVELAEEMYKQSCAACHGDDLQGAVGPALDEVGKVLNEEEILDVIENGKGSMPAGLLSGDEAVQISKWLAEQK